MDENKDFCFVIMPTGEDFDQIYEYAVEKAVQGHNMECILVHNIPGQGNIIAEITDRIYNAKLVIADLTNNTPEILYELGLTHGLLNNVIMITQNSDDLPFDLNNYRVIQYSTRVGGDRELKEKINSSIEKLSEWIDKSNPIRTYLPAAKLPVTVEKYNEIKAEMDRAKNEVIALKQEEDNFRKTKNELTQKAKELDDTKKALTTTQKELFNLVQADEELKKTGIELSNTTRELNNLEQKIEAVQIERDEQSETLKIKDGALKHCEQKVDEYKEQVKEIQKLRDENNKLQAIKDFAEQFFQNAIDSEFKDMEVGKAIDSFKNEMENKGEVVINFPSPKNRQKTTQRNRVKFIKIN
ncbi:hypothetical protein QUF76_02730 [Desulfobacterales bacterium HSG16]|nr:hypothetical protein [Desulfobacterales bacterium HSG16]